jgi:hypothetical protein
MAATFHLYVYDEQAPLKFFKHTISKVGNEISLSVPMEIGKHMTKASYKELIMPIRSAACKGNIDEAYITNSFSRNNYIVVIGTETVIPGRVGRDGVAKDPIINLTPYGFVIGTLNYALKNFYIDIICSSNNLGEHLLLYVIKLANEKRCHGVTLNSLPSVLTYYPRQGFKFRKSCSTPVLVNYESSDLKRAVDAMRAARIPLPSDSEAAYKIDEYVDFMKLLHAAELNKKTKGECNKKAAISKDEIKSGHCGEDGYTMVKCFADEARGGRRRSTRRRMNRRRRTTRRKN